MVLTGAGESRVLRRRGHEGRLGASGLEYWASPRPGGFGGIALRDTLDVPVIARVNGHALGGGFEMMLGCDIVVASADATFGLPEPRVGRLPLDGGMVLLRAPHSPRPGDGHAADRPAHRRRRSAGATVSSTRSSPLTNSMTRSSAGSPTSSPARRSRCARSSRWCAAGERVTAREAQMLRLPALIEACNRPIRTRACAPSRRSARPNGASPECRTFITAT